MAQELDRVIKMLASKYPSAFMQILFGQQSKVNLKRIEDTAINIPERRSDKVYRVYEHNREAIINFEFMIEPDRRRLKEFHCKSGMLTASFDCEVLTVIMYLDIGRYRTFPDSYNPGIAGISNRNQFEVRLLWDFKEQIESGELKELIPLLVLCEEKPAISVLEKEMELINQIHDQKERSDMLALAMMVAFRKYREEIVRTFFREERELMKESDFIQEFINEGREEGWKEGREDGWKEGREDGWKEGRIDGQLTLIKRLIEKKFNRMPEDITEDIELLNYEQLEELASALMDMTQSSELRNWLVTHQVEETNHFS